MSEESYINAEGYVPVDVEAALTNLAGRFFLYDRAARSGDTDQLRERYIAFIHSFQNLSMHLRAEGAIR